MQTALTGLRNRVELYPFTRVLQKVNPIATAVLYFELDENVGHFVIKEAAYPESVPSRAKEAFEWIRENHFPRQFHKSEYERLVRMAKGSGHKKAGWKDRFMIFEERFECIS